MAQKANKLLIHFSSIFFGLFLILGCNQSNSKEQKNQEKPPPSFQEQLDAKYGKYKEEIKPENKTLFKAYNKVLKLWDVPYGEVNIKTRFGNAHVIVSGPENGKSLVLLHGMNASSTMWYPNIKALTKNHRVYAIDYLIEPGKSELKVKVKNMEEILSWYNEIFAELKLKEFSLIGASRGGWQAIKIALEDKHKIEKLVLLSPAQTFTLINPSSEMLTNIVYTIKPKRKRLQKVLETMSSNVGNIKQEFVEQYHIASQKASVDKFVLQMMPYSNKELEALKMPVLVLIGDEDIINDDKSIEKAKETLPHSFTEIITNAGHFLSIDQNNVVNSKILEFLNFKNRD